MTSKATYRGPYPVFGVRRDHTYTVDLRTIGSEHGTPYLWVRVQECPDYLMPYESIASLLAEWNLLPKDAAEEQALVRDHVRLTEQWLEIYVPDGM